MLIPCIDLQGGQAVQLVHGRKRELAVDDVLGLLDRFGHYEWLHVIDLDAAMGTGQNNKLVKQLCLEARRAHGMKVRVGGGIRTVNRADVLVNLGVQQIIIGSAAFRAGALNIKFLEKLRARIGRTHIVIALDTARGAVVTKGWRTRLKIAPEDVMKTFEPFCAAFLCTDVDREGTMRGVNLNYFRALRRVTPLPVIAAGGISTSAQIRALATIGMDAAVGMALYKNRIR
jgi:phosphoribosylformimino-5-aminoimidazole carboxamide ribotide isomerase